MRITIHKCDVCGKYLPEGKAQPFTVKAFYHSNGNPMYEFGVEFCPPTSIETGACSLECVRAEFARWISARQDEIDKENEAAPVPAEEKPVALEGVRPC